MAPTKIIEYEYQRTDLVVYKAIFDDNWNSVRNIFEEQPGLRTKSINIWLETPLMIAVGTDRSHDFVKNLLCSLSSDNLISDALDAENKEKNTPLHFATHNKSGNSPLLFASRLGKKNKLLEFLFSRIGVLNPPTSGIPARSLANGDLLTPAIEGKFLELALELTKNYSNTTFAQKKDLQRSLVMLAKKPELFLSGSKLGFWGRLGYSFLPDGSEIMLDEKRSQRHVQDEESIYTAKKFFCCKSTTAVWFKRILQYLASPIMNIYDMKITHRQAKELVKQMCKLIIEGTNDKEVIWVNLVPTIFIAVEYGIYEVIEECILAYPRVTWATFLSNGVFLFHSAISNRQEQVYNLVYQMSSHKAFLASRLDDATEENALHIVAKMAPAERLIDINGAALRMQHELQWFKEIETNFVKPAYKNAHNKQHKTPKMIFLEEHKDLLKEGQEWMKDTASSSTVVATLIVTMAFAVAFAVPGGNNNDGRPVFLDRGAFMLFIISDAIALFSSATSVLMFLGILTSRYSADDFLYTLPQRMTIGLVFLFLSLAATLVAFSATLSLVLQDKVTWIAAPLLAVTSIPVGLFGVLQFPLLVTLVYSTYGPSIFGQQNKRMLH
ncbi:hypothetical protein OSB04_010423 [Centaurea solstitialis]|uniref:PGG domain-containing protein n=1 Tax=Centaurea solstitialis TaxID=347529 RepID=A0AA38T7J5_9ASTR|nr:hypothetical protein OSB04_010423 [Centaurea solstitialis]